MSAYDSIDVRKRLMAAFASYCASKKNAHHSPGGFLPWNNFLRVLLGALNRNADRLLADGMVHEHGKAFLHACHALAGLDAPVRYVSREMVSAWEQTALPRLNFNHPHVLPAFVLFPPLKNKAFDANPENQIIAQVVAEMEDSGILAVSLETRTISAGTVEVGFSMSLFLPGQDFNHLSGIDKQAAALALNAWLVHTYEPKLITTESITSRPGAGFSTRTASKAVPQPPTWIGRDFKVRRVTQDTASSEPGIKLRSHWRSGHWHTVRHGKGRQEERLQWYRPVYVNASNP